jgi:hypothetical protein
VTRAFNTFASPAQAVSPSEVVERLAEAAPVDFSRVDLPSYRGLVPPWNEWDYVVGLGRRWAV